MKKQFFKVDSNTGKIIDSFVFDEYDDIPEFHYEGWGSKHSFYKPRYDFLLNEWVEDRPHEEFLQEAKESKITEFNKICNEVILSRFVCEINGFNYWFSNDTEAQMNFEKMDRMLDKGILTEINWTAYNKEGETVRILLTKEIFPQVYFSHLNHIQSNISKFRDVLQPRIMSATTVEEVNSIKWED